MTGIARYGFAFICRLWQAITAALANDGTVEAWALNASKKMLDK